MSFPHFYFSSLSFFFWPIIVAHCQYRFENLPLFALFLLPSLLQDATHSHLPRRGAETGHFAECLAAQRSDACTRQYDADRTKGARRPSELEVTHDRNIEAVMAKASAGACVCVVATHSVYDREWDGFMKGPGRLSTLFAYGRIRVIMTQVTI